MNEFYDPFHAVLTGIVVFVAAGGTIVALGLAAMGIAAAVRWMKK